MLYEYAETCIIINSNIICNKILIPNVGELKLIIDNSIIKPNTADKITIIDDLPNPDYFYELKLNLGIVNSLLGDYYPLSFKKYPVYVSIASSIFLGNKNRGASSDRPTIASVGFHYYDTDLGHDVVWDGIKWYDPHALDELNGKLSWAKID